MADEEIAKIWRKRQLFKKSEKMKISKKINLERERRNKIPLLNKKIVRITPTTTIGKKEILQDIQEWIRSLKTHRQWKKLLEETITVVETRNKTIGETLLNYREWAKKDWFKIHTCACLEKKEMGRNEAEHEVWNLEEKDIEIGELTTKTVLTPNGKREQRIIRKELEALKKY